MPRLARQCPPGLPVHVIQRGNNRQPCFASEADRKAWYEGRFRSSIVQNRTYFLACQRYIELNPVRAGMVADPADYPWSSYRAHAHGIDVKMWTPHAEYLALGATKTTRRAAYRKLFDRRMGTDTVEEIRLAAKTGLVLGNDTFRKQVETLTGRRQRHLKRGPKPRPSADREKEFLP